MNRVYSLIIMIMLVCCSASAMKKLAIGVVPCTGLTAWYKGHNWYTTTLLEQRDPSLVQKLEQRDHTLSEQEVLLKEKYIVPWPAYKSGMLLGLVPGVNVVLGVFMSAAVLINWLEYCDSLNKNKKFFDNSKDKHQVIGFASISSVYGVLWWIAKTAKTVK